jgi:hypothetical protein
VLSYIVVMYESHYKLLYLLFIDYTLRCNTNIYATPHQVFDSELKLYEAEGIDVVVSSCPDNSECIELLSGRQVN